MKWLSRKATSLSDGPRKAYVLDRTLLLRTGTREPISFLPYGHKRSPPPNQGGRGRLQSDFPSTTTTTTPQFYCFPSISTATTTTAILLFSLYHHHKPIVSIVLEIHKRDDNENPTHFIHEIKTKGYDVIDINMFHRTLMRMHRKKR